MTPVCTRCGNGRAWLGNWCRACAAALGAATKPPSGDSPSKELTQRQREVLAFMWVFFEDNDQLPTNQAIAEHFGMRSPNSAQHHLIALKRKGFIEKNVLGKFRFSRHRLEPTT